MAGSGTVSANADGYTVDITGAQQFVTSARSVIGSLQGTTGALGASAIDATSFATIGGAVGTANDSLQTNLVSGLNTLSTSLTSMVHNVDTAIQAYVLADTQVAQAYQATGQAAQQTRPVPKLGPGNEPPLPPYDMAKPSLADRALKFELGTDGLAYLGPVKGWWNAEGMFQHYLYGNGEDYQVDPKQLMRDVPSFGQAVDNFVAQHQGQGSFDSGWINTNTDITDAQGNVTGQQSLDWYYAMHDWRYRVTGNSVTLPDGTSSTQYDVDVFKPYVFGSPRSDINIPLVTPLSKNLPGGPVTLPQDSIQHLNTVGLARNFTVVGTSSLTRP
ncbi:MAG TPA: hypothetical protein VHV49_15120 [Pseudonocardiaceae bacterium]|jgi:hypothetical protein|nr:hypothetical protein [Pseudonocardiaceae bacterium]